MGRKKTTVEFITEANNIHDGKYEYPDEYIGSKIKIKIICPIHGIFYQIPNNHLSGYGCKQCGGTKELSFDIIVAKSIIIHNNKYEYPKQTFKNNKSHLLIICPIHGEFNQEINSHLNGHGCKLCHDNNKVMDKSEFIIKSNIIHRERYNYDNFIYLSCKHKGFITCYEHGDFKQNPNDHLSGRGCPKCNTSKGEKTIIKYLEDNNIKYVCQKSFVGCKYKHLLKFDFYLPEYNLCIEYDGKQHFESIKYFGGDDGLKKTQLRDNIKNKYCKDNNIHLLRIRYDYDIESMLSTIQE